MWKESDACLGVGKSSVFRTKRRKKNQNWVQVRAERMNLIRGSSSERIVCAAIRRSPSLPTIPGLTRSPCPSSPENIRLSFVLHWSVLQTGFSLQGFAHFLQTVRREGPAGLLKGQVFLQAETWNYWWSILWRAIGHSQPLWLRVLHQWHSPTFMFQKRRDPRACENLPRPEFTYIFIFFY